VVFFVSVHDEPSKTSEMNNDWKKLRGAIENGHFIDDVV
jgi:hypothetical protein